MESELIKFTKIRIWEIKSGRLNLPLWITDCCFIIFGIIIGIDFQYYLFGVFTGFDVDAIKIRHCNHLHTHCIRKIIEKELTTGQYIDLQLHLEMNTRI